MSLNNCIEDLHVHQKHADDAKLTQRKRYTAFTVATEVKVPKTHLTHTAVGWITEQTIQLENFSWSHVIMMMSIFWTFKQRGSKKKKKARVVFYWWLQTPKNMLSRTDKNYFHSIFPLNEICLSIGSLGLQEAHRHDYVLEEKKHFSAFAPTWSALHVHG